MVAMSYVQKWKGGYRIRRKIPPNARWAFGERKEFLLTLGTKDRAEAIRKAFPILAELDQKIQKALGRAGLTFWKRQRPDFYLAQFIAWMGPMLEWWRFESDDEIRESVREFLAQPFVREFSKPLPGSGAPEILMTEADREEFVRIVAEEAARYSRLPSRRPEQLKPTTQPSLTLGQLRDKLRGQHTYTPRSEEDLDKSFAYLIELQGDCPANEITAAIIREWRDCLLAYPVKGRTKNLKLRDARLNQYEHTMNPKTVLKLLGFIRSGFKLALSEGWVESDPTRDIQIARATETSHDAPRVDYRAKDLGKLFASPLFNQCRNDRCPWEPGTVEIRDYRYWVPLLALYSGARLSEIMALEITDIRTDWGVPYFNFTNEADLSELAGQKRKKTKSSIRETPIHAELVRLGFLRFVQAQEDRKGLLFRTRFETVQVASREFSKWWARYLQRIGMKRTGLTFHSFRHTFATATRMAGLLDETHNALTGRAHKGVGHQYGEQKRRLRTLQSDINRIQFEGMPGPK